MEELLNNAWIQGGFAALFGFGGWFFAWRMFRALSSCQALIRKEIAKREELLREMMTYIQVQTHVVDELAEYKSMEQFIRQEVVPLLQPRKEDSDDGDKAQDGKRLE